MHLRPGGNADRLDSLGWRLDGSALARSRIGAARVVRSSSNRPLFVVNKHRGRFAASLGRTARRRGSLTSWCLRGRPPGGLRRRPTRHWRPTSRSRGEWYRQNGWRQHDLTDGVMIGLEKLSEARCVPPLGRCVWCHRQMRRAYCCAGCRLRPHGSSLRDTATQ
jgi:hypothetical protein